MTENKSDTETKAERRSRLRWVTLGEAVAVSAVIISALGLWISWPTGNDKPASVIEQRASIPLALRGETQDDGRRMILSPVEESHAIDSLAIAITRSGKPIEVGSDGRLAASAVEAELGDAAEEGDGTHRVRVEITTRYVEAGKDRTSGGSYVLSYRWEDGGLFGGRSLRLTGLSRA